MHLTRLIRDFGSYLACYYVESESPFTEGERGKLLWLCSETFEPERTFFLPQKFRPVVAEIGPRIAVATPFSTNAVAICHAMGLTAVRRFEMSRLYPHSAGTREEVLAARLDVMTQSEYPSGGLASFTLDQAPDKVKIIRVLEEGENAIVVANRDLGLGFDAWDVSFYASLFRRYGRNPTDVELFQIANANSEHCRHWYFRGKQVIDGNEMPLTLLDLIRAPLSSATDPSVTVLAFGDNVGAVRGAEAVLLVPSRPFEPSSFVQVVRVLHPTATAETHNHPTMIAPYPGAATGAGGRIRDNVAGGRGSLTGIGAAGYFVGNLFMPCYSIPGEVVGGETRQKHATPRTILIDGSNGVSDYGNEFGEPLALGFCRTFAQVVGGERREPRKPILYSGGIGTIADVNLRKGEPETGMLIMAIGGPAYAIGVGGGAASSMIGGTNDAALDFKSVQRGDGEMGNKAVRVVRACMEMGEANPIVAVHDQGAGGPSNVLTELMGMIGGKVDVAKIVLGDRTMSVLAIWSAEFQERYGILIRPESLDLFRRICARERVNCETLGEVTGDGKVTVIDSRDDTKPVELPLRDILGDLPQKTFASDHRPLELSPPAIPHELDLREAIRRVLALPSVCSKGFLVHKVDRSVTGLVGQQQCCGLSQVPIADFAVHAHSYSGLTGAASSLGEQPLKMLIDPQAGARMSLGEMLTNMMGAGGIELEGIRCRVNWMWPAKLPGEGALLYDAMVALSEALIRLGIAADGGKDSLSMAAKVDDTLVKAPGSVVVLGYAAMPDVTKKVTPDIKAPGKSRLGLIDLGRGKNRLGGSALLQSLNQLGDESPDCHPDDLAAVWRAVQKMIAKGLVLSIHDRSDGGLAATVIEMCLGGICGLEVTDESVVGPANLFSEELGLVIEYGPEDKDAINEVLCDCEAPELREFAKTTDDSDPQVFDVPLTTLRQWWEATSHALEQMQTAIGVAGEEFIGHDVVVRPVYRLGFEPKPTDRDAQSPERPKVAVIREEGTNGDREMAAAFHAAGFEPHDVTMSDLLSGRINLDGFRGLVASGGFSFQDVLDSAKGWAASIIGNPGVKEMFDRFYDRPDTFTLGVCNGCQLFALLGFVPWHGMEGKRQPRFIANRSGRFESRWSRVLVKSSPAIMLRGMEGSVLGIHVAHGEGRVVFPDPWTLAEVRAHKLAPLAYADAEGEPTEAYPWNPNGSPEGIAALCSLDGRHLAMMPHPERCFLPWQQHYAPPEWEQYEAAPWLRMFQNAYAWCQAKR